MALVPAKCTQCGGNIEVDDTHEAGICKFCGTPFVTEKAITKDITTMKTIEEIINRHFATEKELDIIRIPPKFDFQNENQYFEVKGEMNYFVKIKKNLKKEFVNNKILEPFIRVPHIYEYNQTLDNTAEYIIEEYIDGVIVDEYTNELTMYLIGRVFGTAFNIKRQEVNLSDVFKHLNSEDKQLYRKYYSGSGIDGFVLLDVEYVLSNNKENISVIDLENCLYDDVRPYITTYAKVFGEAFVSGFAHASNMKYDDFILSDMEEYLHIKQKVEEIERTNK